MADNVEIKIEQLTDAVKGLYSRPALSQSEINNLMTNLAQRFENSSDMGAQKLVSVVINESKKILEDKHHDTKQHLVNFENLVKQMASSANNPKVALEVTKILTEVTDMFTKLNDQEVQLQKIHQTLIGEKQGNPVNEIIKLNNEFISFSKGFENIVETLNKNFGDFLNQVKAYSSKEELSQMALELDNISGNVSSVISALAIIEHKYQDLTGLINAFSQKEALFAQSAQEVRQLSQKMDELKDAVQNTAQVENTPDETSERLAILSETINTIISNVNESIEQNSHALTGAINAIENRLNRNITLEDFNNLKNDFNNMIEALKEHSNQNKHDFVNKVQDTLIHIKAQNESDFKMQIESIANGIQNSLQSTFNDIEHIKNQIEERKNLPQDVQNLSEKVQWVGDNVEKLTNINLKDDVKQALDEGVNSLYTQLNKVQEDINSQKNLPQDVQNLSEKVQWVGDNVEKITNVNLKEDFKNLNEKIQWVGDNVETLTKNQVQDEIKGIEHTLLNITKDSLANFVDIINAEMSGISSKLDEKEFKNKENVEKAVNDLRNEIKSFESSFESIKHEVQAVNQGNMKLLQEPIERALKELSEVTIKEQLSAINDNVKETTTEISTSFDRIKEGFERIASGSNVEILAQLKDTLPAVSEKFDILKGFVAENSESNLSEIKSRMYEICDSIKAGVEEVVLKIQVDIQNGQSKSSQELKIDLQEISNNLSEKMDTINHNVNSELEEQKNYLNMFVERVKELQTQSYESFSSLESNVKDATQETLEKISSTLEVQKTGLKESINNFKNEVVEGILGVNRNNKTNFDVIEDKVNQLLNAEVESQNFALLELLNNVLEKIEHSNVQQIHNAKELLEEIQNNTNNIVYKIQEINKNQADENEVKETQRTGEVLFKLDNLNKKLAKFDPNADSELKNSLEFLKVHLEGVIKNSSESIVEIIRDSKGNDSAPSSPQEVISKIDEYLSNIEYQKNNISADIKECVETQILNIEEKNLEYIQKIDVLNTSVNKLATNVAKFTAGTDSPEYSYSLQDVESDLAKVRLSVDKINKGEDYKDFASRLVEIKNINLETAKLNTNIETQMARLNAWFKGANQKLEKMAQQVEQAERISVEEAKTRLMKSSSADSGDFSRKQMNYLEELDDKLNMLIQKQGSDFDPASFIDVTYENMKYTKHLNSKIDDLEDKIDKIYNYMERIIDYIEE